MFLLSDYSNVTTVFLYEGFSVGEHTCNLFGDVKDFAISKFWLGVVANVWLFLSVGYIVTFCSDWTGELPHSKERENSSSGERYYLN